MPLVVTYRLRMTWLPRYAVRGSAASARLRNPRSEYRGRMAEARFARHMSDEDALMWNIEKDPVLRSTIVAVGLFDSVPDWDRLRRRIDRATLFIPRFR